MMTCPSDRSRYYQLHRRTAHREHWCSQCLQPIERQSRYVRVVWTAAPLRRIPEDHHTYHPACYPLRLAAAARVDAVYREWTTPSSA